jgi:DNA invertase Pin-like site-specific DNA recombinase
MVAARSKGQRIGYKRVSSVDQNADRQLDGIDVDKTFTDKASGKDVNRPQLKRALEYLREGDTLVVHSMDGEGITVEFVKEGLRFTGDDDKMAQLMLGILGSVAQFERSLIRERQLEGIALAKKKGVYKGRKPSLSVEDAKELRRRAANGENKTALAQEFGISRAALYVYLASS